MQKKYIDIGKEHKKYEKPHTSLLAEVITTQRIFE